MLSSIRTGLRNTRFSGAEIFLLIVLLAFGIPMALIIPVGAGQDEDTHLVRVWELSEFAFLPEKRPARQLRYPAIYEEVSYRNQVLVQIVEPGFWTKYGGLRMFDHGFFYGPLGTRSLYSPALLLPQALAMRYFGRRADLPALFVFYACRFAGLLSYILLVWAAVRLIPFGKWLLAILAASPMALFQASTITADTISNGIGFLFVASSLTLAKSEGLGWREWLGLAGLVFMLFLAKINLIGLVLLPLLIIPPAKYRNKSAYWLLIVAVIVLFSIEVLGWNLITYSYFEGAPSKADPSGQLMYILGHPLPFFITVLKNLSVRGLGYLTEWIGLYGYGYWSVPAAVYVFYVAGIAGALLLASDRHAADRKTGIALALTFLASYWVTVLSLYLSFNLVGSPDIYGIHGRYFIPLVPPLLLAFFALPRTNKFSLSSATWAAILALGALVLFLAGTVLSYYVQCGGSYYRPGLCYQPVYKNFVPRARYSPPISAGTLLVQEIRPACNGMTELRVWVNPSAQQDVGTTEFIFQDSADRRNLASASVLNSRMPAESWYTLSFKPDWVSAGKLYSLKILGLGAPPGQGLTVAYSLKPEYSPGNLYVNGEPLQDDIIFQYGCIAGLQKIWESRGP